jgi:mRNA interferase MazF
MDMGDIYTVEMPASDGHEQAGFRPAIIIQDPRYESQLSTVLIVPLTSRLTAQAFPCTFLIRPTSRNGLSVPSVALVFQLRAIDKRRLKKKMGRLGNSHLAQLQEHVKVLMRLP